MEIENYKFQLQQVEDELKIKKSDDLEKLRDDLISLITMLEENAFTSVGTLNSNVTSVGTLKNTIPTQTNPKPTTTQTNPKPTQTLSKEQSKLKRKEKRKRENQMENEKDKNRVLNWKKFQSGLRKR
jgi:hypothetical protein